MTPDRRLRVFVSSTLDELATERTAVRDAVVGMHLAPIMFELGARPHAPREVYESYLQQSDVFVGVYWQQYGWVAPGMDVSGLEDEYRLSSALPQLVYIKEPAPDRAAALLAFHLLGWAGIDGADQIAIVMAVVMFRSSSNLAAAYGIAVTTDMLITTILTFFVIRYGWNYPLWLCLLAELGQAGLDDAAVRSLLPKARPV